jgi:hypothetical protein
VISIVLAASGAKSSPPPPPRDAAPAAPPIDAADPVAVILADADRLVGSNQRDTALDLLSHARREYPQVASLPYLAGRICFSKLYWNDGIKAFRDAIRLDPSLRSDPELIKTVLRGFITTPDVDRPIEEFLREDIGAIASPYLEETAREHPNAMIRARAQNELKRMR